VRSAVIDLGSHTFHAVVADVDAVGVRRVVFDRKIAARVGDLAYRDSAALIRDDAYAHALAAIVELVARTRPRAPERVRVIATGVFRDADNGAQLLADAADRCGLPIELLDARDEARLAWLGVSAELAGSHGRLAVIDLGGGSLELACGDACVDVAHGLPLGALRLRALAPIAIRQHVAALAGSALDEVRASVPDTVALASGTARALLALARRQAVVGVIQRHVCTRTFVELARRLAPLSRDAIAALGVPQARTDTIAAGATAIAAVLEQLGRPVTYVARGGLRDGALVEMARAQTRSEEVAEASPSRRTSRVA